MKIALFIFLICSLPANGQIKPVQNRDIHIGDSLEMVYGNQFSIISYTDTTHLIVTSDGFVSARDLPFVTYSYDTSKRIKKIRLKQGRRGIYYFYFDGKNLRKVRLVRKEGYINLQYYFSDLDNELSLSEIEKRQTTHPEASEWYDLLKISHYLLGNFKTLL